MRQQKKFSKDPKITLVSIQAFFENSNFLIDAKGHLWKEKKRPSICKKYYKFTSDKLILLEYGCRTINFGMSSTEKLESIQVAIRDGITEYKLFDDLLVELQNYKKEHKRSKKADAYINELTDAMKLLPKYKTKKVSRTINFEECLEDLGYKTDFDFLKNKYVVFDVETNGTRTANDDLLSLSIYDPTTGICYNRFFPLDLQPLVLTGWIHGITNRQLANLSHLTQNEVDNIINFFDLKNKTMLSFSGGKGLFDASFLINYCKRHNLYGFEGLQYENIKSYLPSISYVYAGQMTKDNLCKLFGIEGLQEIHSSQNDCLLEWKLFEKIKDKNLFFINNKLYKYNEGYIVPVSYLNSNSNLATIAKIEIPNLVATCTEIYRFNLPSNIVGLIKKFPTNITGIAVENGINSKLNVTMQDNTLFLARNKQYVNYIGSLESNIQEIHVTIQKDGTLKSSDSKNDEYIAEVNKTTKLITDNLKPVFDYIKDVIFKNEEIKSQELCISDDRKVLALCDLSSTTKVLEIKTKPIRLDENNNINIFLARQLFYESKGRDVYLLSIDIQRHFNEKYEDITDSVGIIIYNVALKIINDIL